jgi:hypothetical protein
MVQVAMYSTFARYTNTLCFQLFHNNWELRLTVDIRRW